jgi:predicted DNA binding CopG/RHH family protein
VASLEEITAEGGSAKDGGVMTIARRRTTKPVKKSTENLDWSKARLARFPNLKPSTKAISLRLPVSLLERIKLEANKRDVPYQSLIKIWLMEAIRR